MNKLTEVSVKNGYKATYNHYRKLAYPLFLILLVLVLTSPVQAKYSGGTGGPNNPYRIATAADLNDIGNHVEDFNKCFVMVNDVNLSEYTGTEFNIIGSGATPFTGIFDGNSHAISNFSYSSTGINCIGLFGRVYDVNAVIRDLTLIDPNINVDSGYWVGSLVGWLIQGKVSNCYVIGGEVRGYVLVGGLVGDCGADIYLPFAEVVNCGASVNVVGSGGIGGLIGKNLGGTISRCYATGDVSGAMDVGGLVGAIPAGTLENCYATGAVSGNENVGGLVAYNSGSISNCYAIGDVNVANDSGGFVGEDDGGSYTKCFWDSDVNPDVNGIGNTTDPNVIGKSTTEMKTESTYVDAGWDLVETWRVCDGLSYPKLLWQLLTGDFVCPDGVDMRDFAVLAGQWQLEKLAADVAPNGGDGIVNFLDWAVFANTWPGTEDMSELAVFAQQWLRAGASCCDIAPVQPDGIINTLDLAAQVNNWLVGVE